MKQYDKIYIPDGIIGEVRAKHAVISGKPLVLTEDTDVIVCTIGELRELWDAAMTYQQTEGYPIGERRVHDFSQYLTSKGISLDK